MVTPEGGHHRIFAGFGFRHRVITPIKVRNQPEIDTFLCRLKIQSLSKFLPRAVRPANLVFEGGNFYVEPAYDARFENFSSKSKRFTPYIVNHNDRSCH